MWEREIEGDIENVFVIVMKKALHSFKYVVDKKIELTDKQIMKIISQIVDAMEYIYGVIKIAHCELKPENILIMDDEYNIMIADFGISKKLIENSFKFGYTKSPKAFIKIFRQKYD